MFFYIFALQCFLMATRGRPKKDKKLLKKRVLQVRLLQEEKETFEDAARLAGLPCASWVRERLRQAARKELKSANQKIKFL